MKKLADFIERNMMECTLKGTTGVECPGCGFQRSLVQLLNGNFKESIEIYPALIPTLLMFLLILLQIKFRSKYVYAVIIGLMIVNTVIIVISYKARMGLAT